MNIQTGIDLVELEQIKKSIQNPRFLTRFFSPQEQSLFANKHDPTQTIAANFAAKEAFSKSIGTGIRGFSLSEVSVLRDQLGKPYLVFSGKAQQIVQQHHFQFSISLTHTKHYAAAVVIAYQT